MLGGDVLEESPYWNQAAILPVLGKVRIFSYEGAQVWSAKKRTHLLRPHLVPESAPQSAPHLSPKSAPHLTPHLPQQSAPQLASHLVPKLEPHLTPHLTPHLAPQVAPHLALHLAPQSAPQSTPHLALLSALHLSHGSTVVEWLACSPPTKAIRVQSLAGSLHFFSHVCWSAGFLRDLPFHPPSCSGAALYPPQSTSSALKTSMLGATNSGQPIPARCLMPEAARWKYGLAANCLPSVSTLRWLDVVTMPGLRLDVATMPNLRRLDVVTMPGLKRHDGCAPYALEDGNSCKEACILSERNWAAMATRLRP
ncbi:hypothetical protein PR048_012586 [Dryococelus australis]|uniref:Uncharacterized protein n=1 Tax=Dryococelus australis TaxID=614101 RepID=A0ABQ9HQE9_9NEOP|nr:hypothetical protein PR048_012586 [Dryococelus australis]